MNQTASGFPVIVTVAASILALGLLVFFVVAVVKSISRRSAGWIVAAVLSGVLGLLMVGGAGVGGLVMLGRKRLAEKAAATDHGGVMTSKGGGMQVTTPAGWGQRPVKAANGVLTVVDLKAGEQVVVTRRYKVDVAGGGLNEFEAQATERFLKELTKVEAGEPAPMPAGAYPGLRRRVEGTIEHGNFVFETETVETQDAYYRLVARAPRSQEAAARPVFEGIFASFSAMAGPPQEVEKPEAAGQ